MKARFSMTNVFLETERLLLRQFTKSDVNHLFELDSNPAVVRFVDPQYPIERETIIEQMLPRLLHIYEVSGGKFGFWAAIKKASGEFIGWFQFLPPSPQQRSIAELGYRLKPSAWSKGYATEGSKALIHKGFTELGCTRVISCTLVANQASIRVMEKAGLRFEKYWMYHSRAGVDEPAVMYSLLRQDWKPIM